MLSKHDLKVIQELLLLQEYFATEEDLFELELNLTNGELVTKIEKWSETNIDTSDFIDFKEMIYNYPLYKIAAYYADKIELMLLQQEVEQNEK